MTDPEKRKSALDTVARHLLHRALEHAIYYDGVGWEYYPGLRKDDYDAAVKRAEEIAGQIAPTAEAYDAAYDEFSQAVNLDTGDVQLTYNEETRANTAKAGQMDVPSEFVVKLSPFLGMDAVPVAARLRWTIDGGQLGIGFKLHRPDLVKRDAFAGIRATIAGQLAAKDDGYSVPVLLGPAPAPLAPQQ